MTQMVWNTLHGRILYVTNYFGTNMPRWGMSHVDPILLLFVPIFALYQHPLTLVFSQLVLVIFSSVLIYKVAELHLNSKLSAFALGMAYLFYPAVGFLTAWTAFHGVSVAIPFFLGAFYVLEKAHHNSNLDKKSKILFWIFLIVALSGKEQISLYAVFYGIYILLFRGRFNFSDKFARLGLTVSAVGLIWFALAFFVVIPGYAHLRIEGYQRFAQSLDVNPGADGDVTKSNYFLSRYEGFGDSYTEVLFGMITHPGKVVRVFFGGDNPENLKQTFDPLLYFPLLAPGVLVIALPDFLMNYLTTAGGIGTAEIYNHRVSMIIPILLLATIFSVKSLGNFISLLSAKVRPGSHQKYVYPVITLIILGSCIQTSFAYQNPVYMWMSQAIQKRLILIGVEAKTTKELIQEQLEVGEVIKLSDLENKDRECANKVVEMVPDDVSISGPDYLGAHLAQRETYAIFPALHSEADYVIVDVFAQKILRILDADLTLVRDVVGDLVKNEDYKLVAGCGNLFIFKNVGPHGKEPLLPLQERYSYEEKFDYEIFQTLTVVDYELPERWMEVGENTPVRIVYVKRDNNSLSDYFLFMSLVNKQTGEIYQAANLPSFGLKMPRDWTEDHYYIENVTLALPEYLVPGEYMLFVGMSNVTRTRSLYLGDVRVVGHDMLNLEAKNKK